MSSLLRPLPLVASALLACASLSGQAPIAPAAAPAAFPHVVLDNTELRPLHSKVTGRDYLLYIGYPDSYRSHPERRYPVVYLTDAYWGFVKTHSLGSSLWYDQIVPEYIVVGIGYAGENVDYGKERLFELTPSVMRYGWAKGVERQGGARQFLAALKTEVIPYVENNLRVDPKFRVMAGGSLGGLFSLFCMYEEPALFQGIIAASPAVDRDHRWLSHRESELRHAARGDDLKGAFRIPTRLYMSVGTGEWPEFVGGVKSFHETILAGAYADFAYKFQLIEGERHGGTVAEAFNRGLRFVFEPQMPSPVMP
ncbi:MAG: alpha/beta hydrolase-fold protein [Opitutaceae bacterium]